MVFAAFKTPQEFTFNFWLPPRPEGFTFDNLREVWLRYKFYIFFRNSVVVSAGRERRDPGALRCWPATRSPGCASPSRRRSSS